MSSLTIQADPERIEPKCAWLTVNRACNFRYPWCYAQGAEFDPKKNLALDLALRIIELILSLEIKHVAIIGGEPTLWPHLFDFNKYLRLRGMKSGLVTNAMRFGVDSFWEEYVKFPNTGAGISVKAWDIESSAKIIKVENHDLVARGLSRGIKLFGQDVSIVINTTCVDNLADIAKFVIDQGAKRLLFNPCAPAIDKRGNNTDFVVPHHELVKKFVEVYPELDRITEGGLVLVMKIPLCVWPKDFIEMLIGKKQISSGCQLQHRTGIIFDTDGSLMICNGLYDFPVGKLDENFSDKETLLNLLNSDEVVALYDKLLSYPSDKCDGCLMWENCGGGCPLFWTSYSPEKVIKSW